MKRFGQIGWMMLRSSEFLPEVIACRNEDLLPLSAALKSDSRMCVVQAYVYAKLLESSRQTWDLFLIDVDHSPHEHLNEINAQFYTAEGLQRVKKHHAPTGVFAVWSYAESSTFVDALRAVFSEVSIHSIRFENRLVNEEQTDWLFFAK